MTSKITVVNGDTAFLNLMGDLLTEEGYEPTLVEASDQAYEMIRRDKPDLVFIDIGTDQSEEAWTVLDLLRLDPDTANLPVIISSVDPVFLKSKTEQLREKKCEVLEKPFVLDELLGKIHTALG